MHIEITQQRFGERLTFDHDSAARALSGPSAAVVEAMIDEWDGRGILYGTQPVSAPDPLGSSRDMATMLAARGWELPSELSSLLPPAQEIPEGAVA